METTACCSACSFYLQMTGIKFNELEKIFFGFELSNKTGKDQVLKLLEMCFFAKKLQAFLDNNNNNNNKYIFS